MFFAIVGKMMLLTVAKIISAILVLIGLVCGLIGGIGAIFFEQSLLLMTIGIIIFLFGIAGWFWSTLVINKFFPIKMG